MTKTTRVYDLFESPNGGPSAKSDDYGRASKRIWKVAATSIKQAYFLVANDNWYGQDSNHVGILATTRNGGDTKWDVYDGTEQWGVPWKHYANFKG